MDVETLTSEIQEIKRRLAEIEAARHELAETAFAERASLLDEKHALDSRLRELQEIAADAGAGTGQTVARDADPTTPVGDHA